MSAALGAEHQVNEVEDRALDPQAVLSWLETTADLAFAADALPEATRSRLTKLYGAAMEPDETPETLLGRVRGHINSLKDSDRQFSARVYVAGFHESFLPGLVPDLPLALRSLKTVIRKEQHLSPAISPASERSAAARSVPVHLYAVPDLAEETESPSIMPESAADTGTPDKEMLAAERPVSKRLSSVFGGILTDTEVRRLESFDAQQRAAFVSSVADILERNGMRPKVIARRVQWLDCFMQNMTTRQATQVVGRAHDNKMYTDLTSLTKVMAREPAAIQGAVHNIDELVKAEKPTERTYPESDTLEPAFIALIGKLLKKKLVSYDGINELAEHLTGSRQVEVSSELVVACGAMRQVVHGAIRKLQTYRQDARQGLLTRQDAWLFNQLLGNPEAGLIPASLDQITDSIREHNPPFPVTDAMVRERAARAIQRLTRTLAS